MKQEMKGKINPKTKKPYSESDYWAICQAQHNKKSFNYFAPVTKHWIEKNAETGTEQKYMEVTLSGLKEDRDGDRVSEEAINGMIKQLKAGTVPFYLDHGLDENGNRTYRLKDMTGVWVDGRLEGDALKAVVKLNNANPNGEIVWKYAEEGMPIGFSIGGRILKKKEEFVEVAE